MQHEAEIRESPSGYLDINGRTLAASYAGGVSGAAIGSQHSQRDHQPAVSEICGLSAQATLAAVFEHAADAIAVVDVAGRLGYANWGFHAFLRTFDIEHARADEPFMNTPLLKPLRTAMRAVSAQCNEPPPIQRCTFTIPYRATALHYVALISGIRLPRLLGANGEGNPVFLLVMREESVSRRERVAALCQRYGLTCAETRVLARFADGEDLAQIARSLKVSIHTARLHMKVLLEKTACPRQAELMRLLGTVVTGRMRIDI